MIKFNTSVLQKTEFKKFYQEKIVTDFPGTEVLSLEEWLKNRNLGVSVIENAETEKWKTKILKTELPRPKIRKLSDLPDAPETEEESDDEKLNGKEPTSTLRHDLRDPTTNNKPVF